MRIRDRHHLEMFRDEINCIHQEQNYHNFVYILSAMNSIILIAACAVCLDQLFFRRRLASYVVDNLKGPKKKHTGHNAAPHTPNAGTAPRQTPEILVVPS